VQTIVYVMLRNVLIVQVHRVLCMYMHIMYAVYLRRYVTPVSDTMYILTSYVRDLHFLFTATMLAHISTIF